MKHWKTNSVLIFLALSFTALIFIIDVNVPLGVAIGAVYSLIILYTWLLPGRYSTLVAAIVCTVLIFTGQALSDNTSIGSHAPPLNRIISVIVIWVCSALVTIAKRGFQGLEQARNKLEEKVITRTEALKKSEQRIQQMIEQVQDYAIFLLDTDGNIVSWNKGAEFLLGYTKEEAILKNYDSFCALEGSSKESYEKHLEKATSLGKSQINDWRVCKDGSVLWVDETITAIRDEKGFITGLSVVIRNITEKKRTEEMLEATNQMARVGGWEVDLIKETVSWSSVTKEIHEVPPHYIPDLATGIEFYKEGKSRETITDLVNTAIEHGTPFDTKLQIITAKGNERWVRSIGRAEFVKGKCQRLFGTFQDIHNEQLKDLKLAESEISLKQAQGIAKIGSWEWFPETNQVIWSDQLFEIFGMGREEHTGSVKDIFQFIHPDDLERVKTTITKAAASKKAIPIEYRIITKQGQLKHIRGEGGQVLDEDSKLVKFFGTLQDITERVQLATQLDSFFNNSLELMCIANTDGYFLRLNPKWEQILGYTDEELKSKPFIEFVHPEDKEATIAEASKLARGHKTISFTNRYRKKDGNYLWLEWSSAVEVHSGLLYATARNITEEVKVSRSLKMYAQKLEAKNKELEQFAYIASHDLQEPLRTVTSFTEMLAQEYEDKFDEQGKKMMHYITQAGTRMRQLIKGLLDYSRLGHNAEQSDVDCNQLVESVKADLAKAMGEHKASLKVKKLPTVKGFEIELRLLFQNLISNALKFNQPGIPPEVEVKARKNKDHWEFSVKDNGIGIAPAYKDKIFLIFQRLNTREEYDGTGIGLANCRKIVDLHDGEIWVESEPGAGSTFHFTIPI